MNHARQLITDLLSDEYQMLWKGEIPPYGISIFSDPEANEEVRTAVQRIEEKVLTWLDPDNVYREERRHMSFLDDSYLILSPATLVLVLMYRGEGQRVLELTLNDSGARLHFRK